MFIIVRNYAKKYRETYRLTAGTLGSVNIINPEDAEVSNIFQMSFKILGISTNR